MNEELVVKRTILERLDALYYDMCQERNMSDVPDERLLFSGAMTGIYDAIQSIKYIPPVACFSFGQWHSVKDGLPKNEQDVLITVKRRYWNDSDTHAYLVVKAFYTDGNHNTEDSNYVWNDFDSNVFKYDEDKDAYIIPEGWWESTEYSDEFSAISIGDEVTHWMELPAACREGDC